MRRWALLLAAALCLAGCLEKVDGSAPRDAKRGDDDKPRQVCEHTSEGGEARTFCY